MRQRLTQFRKNEDGAVTVDWVVVTAFLVALGIAIIVGITGYLTTPDTGLVPALGRIIGSASSFLPKT